MTSMKYICTIGFDTRNLGALDFKEARELLKYSIKMGIDFFDVSPHFMKGESEKKFLDALSYAESEAHISYKLGRQLLPEDTKEKFYESFFASLKRFNASCFDVYTIYDINSFERWKTYYNIGGIYETAAELKQKGLINSLAITAALCEDELLKVFDMCPDIDVVFMPVSPLDREAKESIANLCKGLGKNLIAVTPLLGGVLEKYPKIVESIRTNGLSDNQASLKFVSDMDIPIMCAFTSKRQIDEALYAISDKSPKVVKSCEFNSYETFCTGCGLCTMCPIKSSVQKLMAAYNAYIASGNPYDMVEYARRIFGDGEYLYQTRKCIGCRLCEQICPQGIKISERIERLKNEAHKT